ncbi:MAG: rhomboid family intramembrane serine protease [Candidatus Krumholzibacteria bacterium]|nr:rhomboid family intramembrane serine protease [Candidatus Krumholzibacteria bacterium]
MKPKVTIGLIAACIIVHILASAMSGQTGEEMFRVHRDLYAQQVRLYILDRSRDGGVPGYISPEAANGLEMMENAEDYYNLETGLIAAMDGSYHAFDDIEEFGLELGDRDESYYPEFSEEASEFDDWKRLKKRENKVLDSHVNYALGLVPGRMGRVHTFITHMFLHGDFWHLMGNMLFLWVVGCLLEDTWGRKTFLGFYLIGGMFAGLAHCLSEPGSSVPMIGASGAIAAAMGAFTVRHFMTKIKFFYFFLLLFRPFWGTFYLPAFVFLPFWFIQQVAFKELSDFMGGSGVAYVAHIAGYMGGVVTALVFKATGVESKWIDPSVQKARVNNGVLKDPRFDEACELLASGNVERARLLFTTLTEERLQDLNLQRDIAVLYREHDMSDECCEMNERVLKNMLLKSRNEDAARLVLEIIEDRSPASVDVNPQLLLRSAKWLSSQGHHPEAIDIHRFIITCNTVPSVTAKSSIALAKILNGEMSDSKEAVAVLERATSLDIGPELQEQISEAAITLTAGEPAGAGV